MLFLSDPNGDTAVSVVIPSIMTRIAIGVCAVITLLLGVWPSLLFNSAITFAQFLR